MRSLVVGAGAVGGCVAAKLASAGASVQVLDTNEEHVTLLRSPGLRVGALGGDVTTPLDATQRVDDVVEPDVVLLAVRSHATAAALESLAPVLGPRTDVVSLQNGLNEDVIAELVGEERTIGCVVGFGATWIGPGHVELNANGDLQIGRLTPPERSAGADGSTDDRLEQTRELLEAAFPTKTTENIRGALWAKMLVNSMTVLGALGGMLTGDVLINGRRRRLVADVVAEGVCVARSEGVRLPNVFGIVPPSLVDTDQWHPTMQRVLVRVGEAYGAIKSVTWRDFELGRPTEIDAVTGEIVRRGERNGVPTPLSAAVYGMLREIEAGARSPDSSNLDLLVPSGR